MVNGKKIELAKEDKMIEQYAIDELNSRFDINEVVERYGWDMVNQVQTRARQMESARGLRFRY